MNLSAQSLINVFQSLDLHSQVMFTHYLLDKFAQFFFSMYETCVSSSTIKQNRNFTLILLCSLIWNIPYLSIYQSKSLLFLLWIALAASLDITSPTIVCNNKVGFLTEKLKFYDASFKISETEMCVIVIFFKYSSTDCGILIMPAYTNVASECYGMLWLNCMQTDPPTEMLKIRIVTVWLENHYYRLENMQELWMSIKKLNTLNSRKKVTPHSKNHIMVLYYNALFVLLHP